MKRVRKDGLRAYTAEECREKFLLHMLQMCRYWANVPHESHTKTEVDRMEGLCHSICAYIDGRTLESPAIDLCLAPHKEDKKFHIGEGENWFEKGMVINDCSLTETIFRVRDKYYGKK